MRLARTWRPMVPTRSMAVSAMTSAAWMTRSRAALRAMVKLARSGSMPARVARGVGHGGAQDLVGHQQGVDLLLDAGGVRARRTRPPRMLDFSSR